MEQKLIAWARAVKARARGTERTELPTLWVFSDRERLPDPAPVLRRLPKGLCGLVLRPGGVADPAALRRAVAVCRERRFAVVMVGGGAMLGQARLGQARLGQARLGQARLGQAGVGRHFPRLGGIVRHGAGLRTASAHGRAELVRAARGRVDCVFLSPAFATPSHPGATALGAVRWSGLAHSARGPAMALGGITGETAGRLSRRRCAGVAVIGAALKE